MNRIDGGTCWSVGGASIPAANFIFFLLFSTFEKTFWPSFYNHFLEFGLTFELMAAHIGRLTSINKFFIFSLLIFMKKKSKTFFDNHFFQCGSTFELMVGHAVWRRSIDISLALKGFCLAATKTYLSTQLTTDVSYLFILFRYLPQKQKYWPQKLICQLNPQQMLFIYLFYLNICQAATKTYLSTQLTTDVIHLSIYLFYLNICWAAIKTYLSIKTHNRCYLSIHFI